MPEVMGPVPEVMGPVPEVMGSNTLPGPTLRVFK